ncbi:hypothetical protein M3D92_00950 [Micrococcus terreus]|uniref:hypothetical protein n=1 Tax=Micrococcus terreus TaxID=574650 RepID=UPI0021A40D03|nr:hypothetical protein [Micrococcus terreus]MCT2087866.1 hypothetical protein [Micrococcus terreus]
MLTLAQAELRVYEPLSAFPDDVQASFQRARHLSRAQVEDTARRRSRHRLVRDVTDPFPHQDDLVRVLKVPAVDADGQPGAGVSEFYCPEELGLRAELAAVQLEGSMRAETFALAVPEAARQANLERLAARAERTGMFDQVDQDEQLQVRTRTAVWGVPAGWFTLFGREDPVEVERVEAEVVGARMTTSLTAALERGRRAAVVMSRHAPDLDLLDDVTSLVAWLQSFHPDAHLELDYGPLAALVWPDDSVFDVQTAIDSLEEGDMSTAVLANHRMVRRWLAVRQLGRAS